MTIFENDEEFIEFLKILADVKAKTGLIVLAYCLMTNHFHLLVAVAQTTLATIMHQVLSRYGHWFNWRKDRRGHVFQDRYKAKPCLDDQYMSQVLPYIHRNPVKSGIVENPADWKWSSHRQFIKRPRSTILDLGQTLSRLGETPSAGMLRYEKLMDTPSDWEPDYDEYLNEPEPPPSTVVRPTLQEIAAVTESRSGCKFLGIGGNFRSLSLSSVRRSFVRTAIGKGYAQREVARFMGLSTSAVHGLLRAQG